MKNVCTGNTHLSSSLSITPQVGNCATPLPCKKKLYSTKPLLSSVLHMQQSFGTKYQHHPCRCYRDLQHLVKQNLSGQCPFTFTDRCTILELFAVLGMVDNTLTGSLSCQDTHIKLPLCLHRALPFLRNLTFFVLESQISFGKSTLLDLTVPQTRVFLSCNSSNSATDV